MPSHQQSKPIGLFGGTFDPIHLGHIRVACELLRLLSLTEIRLIPCKIPPHRPTPTFTPEERLNMVKLGCADQPGMICDDREINRPGISYSIETLSSLRNEYPDSPLFLIIGSDIVPSLLNWYQATSIFTHAHIVIMLRSGWPMKQSLPDWLSARLTFDKSHLTKQFSGLVYIAKLSPQPIQASKIRRLLAEGRSISEYIPARVLPYLLQHYQKIS